MALLERREQALGSLTDCAEQARQGEGRLVLVSGEVGVGKSAPQAACHAANER